MHIAGGDRVELLVNKMGLAAQKIMMRAISTPRLISFPLCIGCAVRMSVECWDLARKLSRAALIWALLVFPIKDATLCRSGMCRLWRLSLPQSCKLYFASLTFFQPARRGMHKRAKQLGVALCFGALGCCITGSAIHYKPSLWLWGELASQRREGSSLPAGNAQHSHRACMAADFSKAPENDHANIAYHG